VYMVGFVLFIIPGFVAMGRLAFARFHLLLDKQSLVDAITNSWAATKSYWLTIVNGYLGIFVVLLPMWFLVASSSGIVRVVLETFLPVVEMVFAIFAFRVYSLAKEPITKNE